MVAGPPKGRHACPQVDIKAVAFLRALAAAAGEVTGLVEPDGAVGPVVQIGGQRVLLVWLLVTSTSKDQRQERKDQSPEAPAQVTYVQVACGLLRVSLPSDSVTTTAKNLMAPLMSLNQLQLNLKMMEDLVTRASLTRVLTGGTGGPGEVTSGVLETLHLTPDWPIESWSSIETRPPYGQSL